MRADVESRSYKAFRAYVIGDYSEPNVFSDLKGIPREEAHRVLALHRQEFDSIDPARSVILESLL